MTMRLFNTIAIFDVYIVAGNEQTARDTLINAIASGDLKPSETTATESRFDRSIRQGYRDERPFIAADVSDADYKKKCKGKTTIQIFQHIYEKRG
jgi:hypothetical protein